MYIPIVTDISLYYTNPMDLLRSIEVIETEMEWGSSADDGSATPSYRLWASISQIRQIFHRLVH